jgi:hypothetical protein
LFVLGVTLAGLAGAQSSDQQDQYQGPEILSRNQTDIGQRGGALLNFRPYADLSYVFDDGLTPVSVTSTNNLNTPGPASGINAGFGVIGSKRWHFDQLNLEYRGGYTYYTPATYFNGTSQYLGLDYTHIYSPHLSINLRENAGVTPYSYGDIASVQLKNTDLIGVPTNELFDNQTIFAQSGVDVTYQRTRRLSFSFGGDAYLIRRRSQALGGLTGGRGRADAAYRIAKTQTISASYSYAYYDYQKTFGNADTESYTLGYSTTWAKRWNFGLEAGVLRSRSLGIIQVPLDPAIAIIVGYGYTNIVVKPVNYSGTGEIKLSRRFEHSDLSFLASDGSNPGNGVYSLSKSQVATVNYSYVALKHTTFSFFGGYSALKSVAQQIGAYKSFNGGVGGTYKLSHATFLTFRYDYRHYSAGSSPTLNTQFLKTESRVSVGLAFSPGEKPLPIW